MPEQPAASEAGAEELAEDAIDQDGTESEGSSASNSMSTGSGIEPDDDDTDVEEVLHVEGQEPSPAARDDELSDYLMHMGV